jgi:presenilin-like A22 family membrane protease
VKAQFRIFLKEALLFGGVQALALLAAWRIKIIPQTIPAQPVAAVAANILLIFGAAVLTILLFMRLQSAKSAAVLKIFWLLALLGGASMFLGVFFGEDIALPLAILLVFIYAKAATVGYHNFLIVISLAGIGATLGIQFVPRDAIIILTLLSVYDIIAVYWTGHMVKMAQHFIDSGIIPGIVISIKAGGPLWLEEVRPSEEAAILGTGDLVLPAFLSVSAFKAINPIAGLASSCGALLGLFLMHRLFFGQKVRRPMPALPPIAAGGIVGLLIALLFL